MDVVKVWRAARAVEAGRAIEVEGLAVSLEVVAALRNYPEPFLEGGEPVFAKGPSPRRRLVEVDGRAVLEVV